MLRGIEDVHPGMLAARDSPVGREFRRDRKSRKYCCPVGSPVLMSAVPGSARESDDAVKQMWLRGTMLRLMGDSMLQECI